MTRSELRAALEGGDDNSPVVIHLSGDDYQSIDEVTNPYSGETVLEAGEDHFGVELEDESDEDGEDDV